MKYICPICGYVYDESKESAPFDRLPEQWVCPVCGAAKSVFVLQEEIAAAPATRRPEMVDPDALRLSPGVLAAVFSNLARGCEKQYKPEEQALMMELADYFTAAAPQESDADQALLAQWVTEDLSEGYPGLRAEAVEAGDRGTQRICVWGEKVTRMVQALLSRYAQEGEAMLAGNELWVCTVCGFLYVGPSAPKLCPVCKVPDWKFEKLEGRA